MATDSTSFDHILTILGAFVPLASALASLVNHRVRKSLEAGVEAPKALLAMGSVLNAASVNVDKAVQLARMFKGAGADVAGGADVAPAAPAAPAVCPTCGK